MSYYEFNCARCGGFVGEPMKPYGYVGPWCHCAEPERPKKQRIPAAKNSEKLAEEMVENFLPQVGTAGWEQKLVNLLLAYGDKLQANTTEV